MRRTRISILCAAVLAAMSARLTLMARLDAVDERLTAIVYAVTILRGTLNRFYVSLTDAQRAKFDAMSPPPRPAGGRRVELR